MAHTGHPAASTPLHPQRWVRSTPSARRSDLLAGRDQVTEAGSPSVTRTKQARVHDNSTSLVRNQAPTTTAVRGEMGPPGTHGLRPFGSSARRRIGKPRARIGGPWPRVHDLPMSLKARSTGPDRSQPARSASARYWPR